MSKSLMNFKKIWKDIQFESSSEKTPEFMAFANSMKKAVQRDIVNFFPDIELASWNVGHFYISGFLKRKDGKLFYFSIPDVRWSDWADDVLYRTAEHLKDYRGGMNCYTKIDELLDTVLVARG